jgi:hypothetical protein
MKILASALVLLTPALASAHPGHGATPGDTLLHWIGEPAHAAGLALGFALVAFAANKLARTNAR